ncbi:hypothetical protein [Thiosulfativibrio zosterae]|uniref:Porin n=1 Tax=Thiosulfativibrio zosterae TaxID=2675053 RepID=A0A6F8PN22_9GAMM|nr:hypothetical protein [Thiosulfativibrio zosterae]BBP43521.1 hypothetical protein THMIRHAT_12670 [Thiosulfativibrio zosterae]
MLVVKTSKVSLFCIGLLSAPALYAQTFIDAISQSQVYGFAKSMVVYDDKKGGRLDQLTPGFGGKLGVETGIISDFKIKLAGYTATDLGLASQNAKETDLYMFDIDKKPFSVLGEAQLIYQKNHNELILGRQEISSPLIETYDYRIIPNLYQAYTFSNESFDNQRLTISYVEKMTGLDSLVSFSDFKSMSQQAYTSLALDAQGQVDADNSDILDLSTVVGHNGVWMLGWQYDKTHSLQIWNYLGVDTLNTWYADGQLKLTLNETFKASIQAQIYQVSAVGKFKNFLETKHLNADYELFGVKANLTYLPKEITFSAAYNHYTGNENTVTAFGNWGGYPEFVGIPFLNPEGQVASAVAGTQAGKLAVKLPFYYPKNLKQTLVVSYIQTQTPDKILLNTDMRIWGFIYSANLSKQLKLRLSYDDRDCSNPRYDNAYSTASLRYEF